jgi:hypothetical protein
MVNSPVEDSPDRIALIDLDGSVADYDKIMTEWQNKLKSPEEPPYEGRFNQLEQPHIEARRKLVQNLPGFWRTLPRIDLGFDVVRELRDITFDLHVLTKGPTSSPIAWGEKVQWCQEHLPDASVTVSGDKSLVYGRVLFDDFPPYFTAWLRVRPRGLVVCLAHPWNEEYKVGGGLHHPQVFRYDGTNRSELRERLRAAHDRKPGRAIIQTSHHRTA